MVSFSLVGKVIKGQPATDAGGADDWHSHTMLIKCRIVSEMSVGFGIIVPFAGRNPVDMQICIRRCKHPLKSGKF